MKIRKVLFLGVLLVLMGALAVPAGARTTTAATGRSAVLLIPEITGDTVGMYDPYDGTYLGSERSR